MAKGNETPKVRFFIKRDDVDAQYIRFFQTIETKETMGGATYAYHVATLEEVASSTLIGDNKELLALIADGGTVELEIKPVIPVVAR